MNYNYLIGSIALLTAFQLTACVSVDLSKSEVKRATNIKYTAPNSTFREIKSDNIDKGWRDERNGNTISYITDCENPYDPPLETIESGVLSGLQNLKTISVKEEMYNGRASRQSTHLGTVDGIISKVKLVIFKKNSCTYVLSYIAVHENYNDGIKAFQKFIEGFQAP